MKKLVFVGVFFSVFMQGVHAEPATMQQPMIAYYPVVQNVASLGNDVNQESARQDDSQMGLDDFFASLGVPKIESSTPTTNSQMFASVSMVQNTNDEQVIHPQNIVPKSVVSNGAQGASRINVVANNELLNNPISCVEGETTPCSNNHETGKVVYQSVQPTAFVAMPIERTTNHQPVNVVDANQPQNVEITPKTLTQPNLHHAQTGEVEYMAVPNVQEKE